MSSTNAVFVGDGSLLVRCAEVYRQAGHAIEAVVSRNPQVLEWASNQGIAALAPGAGRAIELPGLAFDYLFSVANLQVLPQALLAKPRRLAINFHDGPLPRYAGLNVTSWALLAGEQQHGITWHEMTVQVDRGRIVRSVSFPVGADETALALNARCYEAALASFSAIVADIGRGELTLTPQSGERHYFSRAMRPAALATLDFSRPARELMSMVRALDFGHHANPLALPKVLLADGVVLVRSARVSETLSFALPGTLVEVGERSLRVATASGDIELEGCQDVLGRPLTHLVSCGQVLPSLTSSDRTALDTRASALAAAEDHWTPALAAFAAPELPYPRRACAAPGAASERLRIPLKARPAGAQTLAAFLAWLSALTGQEQVSILYSDASLAARTTGLERWLSAWVPWQGLTHRQDRAQDLVAAAQAWLTAAREAGPCTRDLPWRLGDRAPAAAMSRIGLCLGAASAPPAFELLLTTDASGEHLEWVADTRIHTHETAQRMAAQLDAWLCAFGSADEPVGEIALLPPDESERFIADRAMPVPFERELCVHDAILAQAARTPQQEAVRWHDEALTYEALDRRAAGLAAGLRARGIRPGDIVGLCLPRTPELVIAMLAIMRAGAAYLPLDPDYPQDRLALMVEDSATPLVVTQRPLAARLGLPAQRCLCLDEPLPELATASGTPPVVDPASPAYVIYTSGSTGRPKGVVVTHRNVMNFFAGMDVRVPHDSPGRWLAVTSLSFDISVLELCWTLARGFTVALHSNTAPATAKAPEFSLFYFASDHASTAQDRYRLLMEGARFADREGFAAVWTPERHFHAFGGLYPNPAVTSAAIAAATTRVKIRAGSCVLPLHHPIRVAEEWAFVDNISQGRVGVSFASGWQPNDFVLSPAAFADRKAGMLAGIDTVRRLWRGERLSFDGPHGKPVEVQTLPRPIQQELPVWLTAAGNPETFRQAGESGCNLLTHLLGQTLDEVADKLRVYRAAWRAAGHAGEGHVTLMLHAFIGDDDEAVRETVREPMKAYLRSSVDLIRQAAWSFPTFVQRGSEQGRNPVEIMDAQPLSPEEMDALLEHAFARYYGSSALFGTAARCLPMVEKMAGAGVDEIACLIDFGVATETVLAHLEHLKSLMQASQTLRAAGRRVSVADDVLRHAATHLQCTPSMASMLVADATGRSALSRLQALMVGGEALPPALARELRALVPGALLNMYGPTETTIWSTTCALASVGDFVSLGQPIANTTLSVRTPWGQECPALVAGELLIGGEGVTPGYWQRPELTAERFVEDGGARWYRTGDLVRRHPGGEIEFLGRIDHQVKIRGHRIELGEIEAALATQPGVREAVVVARDDGAGDKRLAAYVTARNGATPDPAQLRLALAQRLPEVMVPASITCLQAFPQTPNGKIDRRALPRPSSATAPGPAATASNDLEQTIAAIWQDVLGLPQVGTTDNFFDLGGHSLLVVQVQRRLREACGREVSITDMFRLPTIRALAAHLDGTGVQTAVGDGLTRANARRLMRSRAGHAPHPAPVA